MPALSPRPCLTALALLLCGACGSDPAAPEPDERPVADPPPFVLTIETATQAGGDQPLTVRLVVTNRSTVPTMFRYGGHAGNPRFDVIVFDRDDRIVWNRLPGSGIATQEFSRMLGPGDTQTFVAAWDLRDNRGARVAPGTYRVSGYVERNVTLGPLLPEQRVSVTVTP